MDAVSVVLLLLTVSMVPLAMLEMLVFAALWSPYVRLVSRPVSLEGLPERASLADLPAPARELTLKHSDGAVLFRRNFGFGRGRPMYLGWMEQDGALRVYANAFPAVGWIPITIAFGAFGGLSFGGGSLIVALIFGGLFALVARYNTRRARDSFELLGRPALAELMAS